MLTESVTVCIVLCTVCIYAIHRRFSRINKFARKLGGPPGLPLVGNAFDFLNNFERALQTLSEWIDKYGSRFVFSFGPSTIIVLNEAKDVETILSSNKILKKSEEYDLVKRWLGEGLITSSGTHWAHRRKLITPTFHFSILESFISPINVHANILLDTLRTNFVHTNTDRGKFHDILPFIARCALDIICETALGKCMNAQQTGSSKYVDIIHEMGSLFIHRNIRPWLRNDFIWKLTRQGRRETECIKYLHALTDEIIAERKKYMYAQADLFEEDDLLYNEEEPLKRLAFLDLLLEAQKNGLNISDDGIREETNTFIFAGHDTVSAAISFCLFNLGNHPEVQEKLHRELDVVFQGNSSRHITSSDLKEMKYLECCIKESLRLNPSVPILGRICTEDFKIDEELIVPAGVTVYFIPYKLHRNSKYFPKPDEYIPERFATGSCMANRNPFAYIPFSAGARNCIGQKLAMIEAKILLATILRRFKIKSEKKPEETEFLAEIVLRSKGGVGIQLQER